MDEVNLPHGEGTYKLKPGIDDYKIPLLRDVFTAVPELAMNIDLKGGTAEQCFEVYKMIVEFQREDITYFGDMNEKKNLVAQEMGKDAGIRTFASIWYTIRTVLLYFFGLLQFFPFKHHSLWFPFFGPKERDHLYKITGEK